MSAFTLIALLLSACAGNQIKPEVKKQVKTTEVQIIIKQPEIYGEVVHSLGGLAVVMGGSNAVSAKEARSKRSNEAIKPVVKALRGYKVKSLAQRVYDRGLKKVAWMKPTKVKVVNRELEQDERVKITRKSNADAVIFVELDYRLNDSFKSFEVLTKTHMYHGSIKDPAAKPEIVYRTNHNYKWDLPNNADGIYDHHKLGKKWSAKKAAVLREKIKEGIETEVKHLVAELQKS